MARKRRRKSKKEKIEIPMYIQGVFLAMIAVFGLLKLGPVGRAIASISILFTGSTYLVFLAILLLVSILAMYNDEWPEFLSTKCLAFTSLSSVY